MSRPDRLLCVFLLALIGCGAPEEAPHPEAAHPVVVSNSAASSSAPVAVLLGIRGDVRIRRAGEVAWAVAEAGEPLFGGDAVQTMEEGRAILQLGDESAHTELASSTTLVLPSIEAAVTRLTQLSGRLLARVDAGGERLEVVLPPGMLVLDTTRTPEAASAIEARVEITETSTDIEVTSGSAFLERASTDELRIDAGHFATLENDGGLLELGFGAAIGLLEPEDGASVFTRGRVTFRYSMDAFITDPVVQIHGSDGWHTELAAGRHEATTDLPEGRYTWTVSGRRDEARARASETRTLTVVLDVEAPRLSLSAPAAGARIEEEVVTIRGSTESGARIDVDGVEVPVDDDGAFRTTRPLRHGLTNLVIRARDPAGNSRVLSRAVVRP